MRKRIVVCCDGTWNTANQEQGGVPCPTNVAKITAALAEQDANGVQQIPLYQPGVGTNRWKRLRGGAFGVGLSRNIRTLYHQLIKIYEPDDEIFLFGFSRGAYTARSLAGLIRKSGILQPRHAARIEEAWSLYRNSPDKPSAPGPTRFRESYSFQPRIRFIGVWDTVGALGIPLRHGCGVSRPVKPRRPSATLYTPASEIRKSERATTPAPLRRLLPRRASRRSRSVRIS